MMALKIREGSRGDKDLRDSLQKQQPNIKMCASVEHPWLLRQVLTAVSKTRLSLPGSNIITLAICPLGYSKNIFQMSRGGSDTHEVSATFFDQGKASGEGHAPAPSRMTELSLELKRTSTWFRMNSTTTDWIRTSMKAAVPLKQADSICFDLKKRQIK